MDSPKLGVSGVRKPLRYSVTALLMVMTAASMLLAVFRPSQSYSVTAFLKVKQSAGVASATTRMSPQEIERRAEDYRVMVTSSEVIDGALAEPGVAKLDVIKRQPNAADWLRKRLNAFYPGKGEILEIRLSGDGNGVKDDERILDAVIEAYKTASDRRKRLAEPDEGTADVTLMQKSSVTLRSR